VRGNRPEERRSSGAHERGAAGILGILAVFMATAVLMLFVMLFVTGVAQRQILPRMQLRAEQAAPPLPSGDSADTTRIEASPGVAKPAWSPATIDSLRALKQQIRIQKQALDARITEMNTAAERLERERTLADDERDAEISEMAKVYANMKPLAAAQVMAHLDDKTFKLVFDKLNKRQAAKIMAFIDPARIARLTKQASVSRTGG
jgi:flagellar motility protein MotE (MotC chaperone)